MFDQQWSLVCSSNVLLTLRPDSGLTQRKLVHIGILRCHIMSLIPSPGTARIA